MISKEEQNGIDGYNNNITYTVDNDMWYKKRSHIYYLFVKEYNSETIIATYSTKTKKLLIKSADKHIPDASVLRYFIQYSEQNKIIGE